MRSGFWIVLLGVVLVVANYNLQKLENAKVKIRDLQDTIWAQKLQISELISENDELRFDNDELYHYLHPEDTLY